MFKKLLSFLLVLFCLVGCTENLPEPEIKTGEFDFKFTYKVNGEEKSVEGTYVCKFIKTEEEIDGINREWEGYVKDHESDGLYELATVNDGTIYVDLDLAPEFFMSDPFYKSNANTDEPRQPEPVAYIQYTEEKANEKGSEFERDLSAYGFEIVSYEYDEPIENTYE